RYEAASVRLVPKLLVLNCASRGVVDNCGGAPRQKRAGANYRGSESFLAPEIIESLSNVTCERRAASCKPMSDQSGEVAVVHPSLNDRGAEIAHARAQRH